MMQIDIDIVSDVMCPWCYIGKKNLDDAVQQIPGDIELDRRWRPYQLDPTLPKHGKDRRQYLAEKFGGSERAREIYSAIVEAGRAAGIPFDFEAIAVSPNTLDAHRVIRWAASAGPDVQDRLVEILFRMFFIEARNIGDDAVLLDAAEEAGMDRTLTESLLLGDADRAAVEKEVETARQMGVTGVPCFILDNKYALMGAQPADVLVNAIKEVAQRKQSDAAQQQDA